MKQEHGAGLGAERNHVPRAIVFLVAPRPLVLPDDVLLVLVDRKAACHPNLLMPSHAQAVKVEAWFRFDVQRALPKPPEIAGCSGVDLRRVRVDLRRKLDLRTGDAQEAEWVAIGQRARFIGVDNVVGNGRNMGGVRRTGAQRPERKQ
jgi:hypothetical protein